MRRVAPARAHVLRRARHGGVAGVEVHLERVGEIAAHHGALEEMHMLQRIDGAGDVVEVARGRLPVVAGVGVHHVHRRAGRAKVDALAPRFEVVARIEAVQHEAPSGADDHVLNGRGRKRDPAVRLQHRARRRQQLHARGRAIRHADCFQNIKGCLVNAYDIGRVQRSVAAAFHTWPYWAQIVRQRRCSGSKACSTPTTAGIQKCQRQVTSQIQNRACSTLATRLAGSE